MAAAAVAAVAVAAAAILRLKRACGIPSYPPVDRILSAAIPWQVTEYVVRALTRRPSADAEPTAQRMYVGVSSDKRWRLAVALSTDHDAL